MSRRVIAPLVSLATLAALVLPALAAAQGSAATDADVRRMIDSLRPAAPAPAAPAPSTSRTRNLVIESVPAAPPPAPAAAPTTPAPALAPAVAPAVAPTVAPTVAPAAASPPRAPAPTGLSLAIPFEPNSSQLRPDSGPMLGLLVSAMLSSELRQHQFLIEGHTDASGTAAQNLRLSRERAEQVRLYLVTLGVASERLRAIGKGSSEPVNARDPRSPENRRVRVVALP